jgi:hypothetical protein
MAFFQRGDAVPRKTDAEFPVPAAWRSTFKAVVDAFTQGNFQPNVDRVAPVDANAAGQMSRAIEAYGPVTLVPLTKETWDSSVTQWTGTKWLVLVDLRTAEEGRSDLVLEAEVLEDSEGFRYSLHAVYVP